MSHSIDQSEFSRLLLKTVFSFMICDGHIADKEVAHIKKMAAEGNLFGDINIDDELALLIDRVNRRNLSFFDDYFKKVGHAQLSEDQEFQILEAAVQTISSDQKIKLEEINFLKILRTKLKSPDQKILEKFPEIGKDFVKKDAFTDIYLDELYKNYFTNASLPTFDVSDVQDITDDVL